MDRLHPFFYRTLPGKLSILEDIALNLRWSWNHGGDRLWKMMDEKAWQGTRNPWWMLQSISSSRLEQLSTDADFQKELQILTNAAREYLESPGWFDANYAKGTMKPVAYFSMEFGLGEVLPLYAGGLGILAGDMLKTASDLHVPMVGIGLLFQQGYFRQVLHVDGWQMEAYPHYDPTNLPIRPVRDASGGWLRVPLELPGRSLLLRVWQVEVGRVILYLLDSNDPMNNPADRSIIYRLYDDNMEFRLIQEMALGICGWRILQALNIPVEICHLNEGHTAFLVLERARSFMNKYKVPFSTALWATRAGNVFTTHTPVAAGFDSFSPELVSHYLSAMAASLNIDMAELMGLGRLHPGDDNEAFNMARLAMRGSMMVNGVSKLHGEVSRRLFQPMFPRWPEKEVPVTHVTNGTHMPSWDSMFADELWTSKAGPMCWCGETGFLSDSIQNSSDIELWKLRTENRQDLVQHVRERLRYFFEQHGSRQDLIELAKDVLDPDVLTLGFARRFTAYKRPNLLLHDRERLIRIINNPERPVQLVIAGKAHPRDEQGKYLIKEFIDFALQSSCRSRIVFLPDYDIAIAQELVLGVDVWINTPRRPWEACGTSGMKVLVNGGLNLSELDGWWAEAYSEDVGWAIGDGREHDTPEWDAVEAGQLYELLENQIIPMFYDRDDRGIPVRWVNYIRNSMSRLTPYLSSTRMLRDYIAKIYLPCAENLRKRTKLRARLAKEMESWQNALDRHWSKIHFGTINVKEADGNWYFETRIYLGELNPDFISVEIFADGDSSFEIVRQPMNRVDKLPGAYSGYVYTGSVKANRPVEHFTLRVVPFHRDASIPLEENGILWQSGAATIST